MRIVSDHLNITQIAESGQCFRMNRIDENKYSLIAYGRYLELTQLDEGSVEFSCDENEFIEIWKEYFDLGYDYKRIVTDLAQGEDEFLKNASQYGKGIRILKQEPFEMLISYIISQNKNIPSIKTIIERICQSYGEHKYHEKFQVEYVTFPSAKNLAAATKEELREMKLGYRDDYIISAAKAVAEGSIDLEKLKSCSHEEAVSVLKQLHGVGDKVANCISLYGLHHIEAFPIDVWISKVLSEYYPFGFHKEQYPGYAGILQQYMFYYIRAITMGKKEK